MANYLEEESLKDAELAGTTDNQLPLCICIDASYSMRQKNRIQAVNESVRRFVKGVAENVYACDTVDLCIIAFGGTKPTVIHDFSHVNNYHYQDIVPAGGTPMGKAIELAVDMIQKEVKKWSSVGVGTYHPWLVIMSDGAAEDDLTAAEMKVQTLLGKHRLKTKCLGLGDGEELQDLARFTRDGKVEPCSAFDIGEFFDMLSRSATGLSTTSPEDDLSDVF